MSGYNTINSMGLTDVDNISHHILTTKDQQDVLKVYFKSADDPTLPDSASFNFERVGSTNEQAPTLVAALEELASLASKQSSAEHKARLLDELEKLELVMASKLKEMREDLARF